MGDRNDGARIRIRAEEHAQGRDNAQNVAYDLRRVAQPQTYGDQKGPQEVGVSLDELTDVVDESVTLGQISRVSVRDERVVELRSGST